MAKVGRNDPCPCGSGKKYKRCCGLNGEPALRLLPPPTPTETAPTPAAVQTTLFDDPSVLPVDSRERIDEARAVLEPAWETDGPERVALANRALAISRFCGEAYIVLAEEALTPEEALRYYDQASTILDLVIAAEQARAPDVDIWSFQEADAFLAAQRGVAECLTDIDRPEEAEIVYRDIRSLDPDDTSGSCPGYLVLLFSQEKYQVAEELLDEWESPSALWAYARAYAAWGQSGPSAHSGKLLEDAYRDHPLVADYLFGQEQPPTELDLDNPDDPTTQKILDACDAATTIATVLMDTPDAFQWMGQTLSLTPTNLDLEDAAIPTTEPRATIAAPDTERVPRAMRARYEEISAITDAVCREHLDDEYAGLSRSLTAMLARKKSSPLTSGTASVWACAVVYTLGWVNFLSDNSFEPHMTLDELCGLFGVSPSSGARRSAEIRKMFKVMQLDPRFTLPSRMDNNPLLWFVMIDGFLVDARSLPENEQELLYQEGLIPYVPGRRSE